MTKHDLSRPLLLPPLPPLNRVRYRRLAVVKYNVASCSREALPANTHILYYHLEKRSTPVIHNNVHGANSMRYFTARRIIAAPILLLLLLGNQAKIEYPIIPV